MYFRLPLAGILPWGIFGGSAISVNSEAQPPDGGDEEYILPMDLEQQNQSLGASVCMNFCKFRSRSPTKSVDESTGACIVVFVSSLSRMVILLTDSWF